MAKDWNWAKGQGKVKQVLPHVISYIKQNMGVKYVRVIDIILADKTNINLVKNNHTNWVEWFADYNMAMKEAVEILKIKRRYTPGKGNIFV
jgi:hypothetical protein